MTSWLRRFVYRWITQMDAVKALKQHTADLPKPKPCGDAKKVRNFQEWDRRYGSRR